MKNWVRATLLTTLFLGLDIRGIELSDEVNRCNQLKAETAKLKEALPKLVQRETQKKNELLSERRKSVGQAFDVELSKLLYKRREEVAQTTRDLEALIKQRRHDPSFTPDALFKLGERQFALAEEDELGVEANYEPTIKSYTIIVEEFPNFIYLDAVLYMLGICHNYMGRDLDSLGYFQRLVTQFPKSRFASEGTFRIGNIYFDRRQFRDALKAYQPLVLDTKSAFHERALYKSAWAHYLLSDFQSAILGFVQVLDTKTDVASSSSSESALDQESREYLAFSFIDLDLEKSDNGVEIVENVSQFFANRPKASWERDLWVQLGGTLFKLTKLEGAALAFERALHIDPVASDNASVLSQVIAIYEELNRKEAALRARTQLVEFLKSAANSDATIVRDNLYTLGLGYHLLGKEKAKNGKVAEAKSDFAQASAFYARYVREFNQEENTDEVLDYLAETLYETDNFRQSATVYAQVRDWPWPTSRRDEAALNVVYALENVIDLEQKTGRLPAFDLASIRTDHSQVAATIMPPLLAEYVASVDALVQQNPKNELTPAFLFKAANLYLIYGKFDEAASRFQRIISGYPQSTSAKMAARTLVNEKIARSDWSAVANVATQFATTVGGGQNEFGSIAFDARFKQANSLLEESKFEQAAQLYNQLILENPNSSYADKILYNRFIALERLDDSIGSTRTLEQLLKTYSKSELAQNALLGKIKSDAGRLNFVGAASFASRYAKLFPNSPQTPDLILDQCFYLEAAQQYKRAADACEAYARSYPDRRDALAASMKAAKLFGRSGDKAAQKRTIMKIAANRRNQQAEPVVEARFNLLEEDFSSFNRMKIDAQLGKNQSAQLTNKTARLSELKKKYEQIVVDAGASRWSVGSLQKIGSLYEGLYRSLLDAPCPKDVARVDESACDEYKSILEDKAFVLEQKAVESYELAIKRAATTASTIDESTLAKEGLYRLQPDKFSLPNLPNFILSNPMPGGGNSRYAQGEQLISQGKFEAARLYFQNALLTNDQDASLHLRLAQVLAELGLDAAAQAEFQKTLSLNKNSAEAFDGIGLLAVRASDHKAAKEAFQNALALNTSSSTYASHLANAYYLLGNWNEALALNKKALSSDKGVSALHFNLGLLYLVGRFEGLTDVDRLTMSQAEFEKYVQTPDAKEKKQAILLMKVAEQKLFIEKQRQGRDAK